MTKTPLIKRIDAMNLAKEIGCSGVHKDEDGNWMPCESHEEMQRISNIAETSRWRSVVPGYKKSEKTRTVGKKKKRPVSGWENLREAPIRGISTLADGSIVSGVSFTAKSLECCGQKGIGPEFVRENDPDVFLDPESAKMRSRQLGCVGISRRVSKNGRTVWMPCTNMTDYANMSGSTHLGRHNSSKRREKEVRKAVRTVLLNKPKQTLQRKKSIVAEIRGI